MMLLTNDILSDLFNMNNRSHDKIIRSNRVPTPPYPCAVYHSFTMLFRLNTTEDVGS